MTPVVSEKDSCVLLPAAAPSAVRPQWMIEVDPGHYLVIVTVGDRHNGFHANVEVGGCPVFAGEWVEGGSFKSRCVHVVSAHGLITVGSHWQRERDNSPTGVDITLRDSSPTKAEGTRLISLRIVSSTLAREVEKERRPLFTELNQKIADAETRIESLRQAVERSDPMDVKNAYLMMTLENRVQSKLSQLYVQKALKLFSLIAQCKRVNHPYIYTNGEASSVPVIPESHR
eukprot:gnl/MRDRNA2_/MRDRNA2_351540_c0_seq1.p1 gnl/MRDRNA2_/MRDRNA2_351540_c0~~gnl/MRDRNA2_/MRDRNA2_351540_c0_seq1.p1  ORF type:complete len:262 (-),score=40.95 gnl/MRDRNA2_/MRDRNA2_351540_c0_seq1:70-759(-)